MRYSQMLIPTVKEVPAEAEIASHQLMIRAGFIRKLASGTYTYLPLGWKSLQKIMQIIRQEMNASGAQEISMPILQPMELWQRTGRDVDYGPTMFKLQDRKEAGNVLAPTAEEVVTSLVAGEISSYKRLPLNLYQINTKFRDELRPRFGVLRSREFLMKDAYSFHASLEDLEATYRKMYDAYCRIFSRCGLKYVSVEAESGPIGGSASHEFMVPCASGEDIIVHTQDFSYAANIEKAEVDPVRGTGVSPVSTMGVPPMDEVHTPNVGSIDAVCKFLGTKPREMIKTLVYTTSRDVSAKMIGEQLAKHDGAGTPRQGYHFQTYVAVIRGDHEVNEAKLHKITGPDVDLAEPKWIATLTGAGVGFAGPIPPGKPWGLAEIPDKFIVDPWVAAMARGVAGANKTDYHVKNVVPGRDFPLSGNNIVVADIRNAVEGDSYQGKPLKFSRGIEVGHVFKLGTTYSIKLGAYFLDQTGVQQPFIMGCYGIGVNRILASAIEVGHDANGCILPVSIAPFEALVVPINVNSEPVRDHAQRLYEQLRSAGIDVLLDDRDERAGVKFKDADLLGIPLRIVVGEKGLKDGKVEIKRRTDEKPTLVPVDQAAEQAGKIVDEMRALVGAKSS